MPRRSLQAPKGGGRELHVLKRQASIKDVQQESMTNKERQGFINAKVAQFEDAMAEVEEHLKSLQLDVDGKADQDLLDIVRGDKISKADLKNHLPSYLVEENLKATIDETCDGRMHDLLRRFEEM